MAFEFSVPTPIGQQAFSVEVGAAMIFVGANGGGKTRLAVYAESALGAQAHRISAHRALELNPAVAKISERMAILGLRTGYANEAANINYRDGHRWQGKKEIKLLNDYDFLVQALFAEQSNKSLETHNKNRAGDFSPAEPTKFEQLDAIWKQLLPHRQLEITGDDIQVRASVDAQPYSASQMSDGERAIFYLIGQALSADANSAFIVDEPELHVHRSIMSKLWDELEATRTDCAFIFITHDLEFAAARTAQKFVVRDYDPAPRWTIDTVPETTGFDEELTTLILGSRKPVLFVEGAGTSLDLAIYRCCYPEWTVIPRGSCEDVIHSVVTMRRNADLTRVTCSGIVDADDYNREEITYLATLGISVLPVSEIENLVLLPSVSQAIAETGGLDPAEVTAALETLRRDIFVTLNSETAIESVVVRYCKRRIDRQLKKIDLSVAVTVVELTTEYTAKAAELNVSAIAQAATQKINDAIANNDLMSLLAIYDNKGLMALAARHLKQWLPRHFESWLLRTTRNGKEPAVTEALRNVLPAVEAR
ncbi:AAA family ATPase [Asticcacaulis sp.]|uniref:AAA family ATPase n=1 Tax=Asticcacaulis sp. TaxID=1872648 RepID=UPI002D0EE3EE|nr:AAA family ATPase [Asticcacaulis sp.]HTM81800.1 AAA family ATPase [Asticcacaulis sp.]